MKIKTNLKENTVLTECLAYLNLVGVFCWRNNTGAYKIGNRFIRYGYKGSSDIIGILPDGRFLAVECKREKGGVLSEAQKDFITAIQNNGGIACVVHSVADLQKIIKKVLTK